VQTGMTSKENNKCEDDPEYDYEVWEIKTKKGKTSMQVE
jgi:hypothetical protein